MKPPSVMRFDHGTNGKQAVVYKSLTPAQGRNSGVHCPSCSKSQAATLAPSAGSTLRRCRPDCRLSVSMAHAPSGEVVMASRLLVSDIRADALRSAPLGKNRADPNIHYQCGIMKK